MAEKFAKDAILAQPFDYLRVVAHDTLHTFGWNRQPDPNDSYGNGPAFSLCQARNSLTSFPGGPARKTPHTLPRGLRNIRTTPPRSGCMRRGRISAAPGSGTTSAVQSWQRLLQIYQRYFYLHGTLLGLIVLIGAAGVLARWRRWGGVGLLPWMVGALLIVLPPMTAGFSYRYVLAAVPAACLAAGLAFVAGGQVSGRPGGRSAAALWPRRRCRSGIASAACRGRPRRAPAPVRRRTAPSRSRWPCRGPRR